MNTALLLFLAIFILLFAVSWHFRLLVYLLVGVIVVYVFFRFFIKKFQHYERAVIFRFGRFSRLAGPGWSVVIPLIERVVDVYDIRTSQLKINVPMALTKEEIRLKIAGTLFYRIVDAAKATLNIQNLKYSLSEIVNAELRNLVSSLEFHQIIANMERINQMVSNRLKGLFSNYGVALEFVQLDHIMPPLELVAAMQKVEIAEEEYEAQKFRAMANRVVINALGEAAKNLDSRAIAYLYVKAIESIERDKAAKIIFPAEFMTVFKDIGRDVSNNLLKGIDVNKAINAIKNTILNGKT